MKYTGTTKVIVPWFDTDGMKQRSLLTIEGDITKHKLVFGIQRFIRENFGVNKSKNWVLKNCPIININNDNVGTIVSDPNIFGKLFPEHVEAWIKRLEEYNDDATETGTDSTGTTPDVTKAEEPLCDLPNSSDSITSLS